MVAAVQIRPWNNQRCLDCSQTCKRWRRVSSARTSSKGSDCSSERLCLRASAGVTEVTLVPLGALRATRQICRTSSCCTTTVTATVATAARTTSGLEAVNPAMSCGERRGNDRVSSSCFDSGQHVRAVVHRRAHRADWLPLAALRIALGGNISGGPRAVWDPAGFVPCRRLARSCPVDVAAFLNLSCCVAKY